jgi:hypothetical protein
MSNKRFWVVINPLNGKINDIHYMDRLQIKQVSASYRYQLAYKTVYAKSRIYEDYRRHVVTMEESD